MKADDLIALNEEIAGMARAGLPLDQGLAALAKEMGRGQLRGVTTALANDLRGGLTLPQALERQAGKVPPFYAGLVSAGVRTGRVAEVLATLTGYARTVANLRATVVEALFYPCVVLVFGVALLSFMCLVVLPKFEEIFQGFGMRVPLITEAMLLVGRRPVEYFLVPLVSVIVLFIVAKVGFRLTPTGRLMWAHMVYGVPVVGTLLRAARLAVFTELLAILVDHKVPLTEAFRLAGEASADPVMGAAARQIEVELSQGQPLGKVLHGRGLVPEWVSWMTGLGERRGTLGQTLHEVADMYRRQVDMRAGLLRNVLPPFMILVIAGLFVFLFIGALLFPVIKLLEGLAR